jgi:putative copper export protein
VWNGTLEPLAGHSYPGDLNAGGTGRHRRGHLSGGFSLNILTLLALVLATGLVVDDSIVVLENITRRRAMGLTPRRRRSSTRRKCFSPLSPPR